jgi:hypothetical protein
MKYTFCDKPVTIDVYDYVYDQNGNCLGKDIHTPEFEHYLIGTSNKGPIQIIR